MRERAFSLSGTRLSPSQIVGMGATVVRTGPVFDDAARSRIAGRQSYVDAMEPGKRQPPPTGVPGRSSSGVIRWSRTATRSRSSPLPLDAVRLDLQAEISRRPLKGVVVEKKSAEKNYEVAVAAGDAAMMLEVIEPGLYATDVGSQPPPERATIAFSSREIPSPPPKQSALP
jgi:hypothetical protein